MSDSDTLSNKEMDFFTELAEQDTRAVVDENARRERAEAARRLSERLLALTSSLVGRSDKEPEREYAKELARRLATNSFSSSDVTMAETLLKENEA